MLPPHCPPGPTIPTSVFPRDHSLNRPEDGLALPDGRLIVADQMNGLRVVASDGTSKPFGNLIAMGYRHRPPDHAGGANGISLEPGGTHLLLADVFGAAIYRVELASGATEKIYQHRYGINSAVRDSKGAIWFTQSAHNTPEQGEARLWAAVDIQRPEGALLRLGVQDGRPAAEAQLIVDSLFFANGLVMNEKSGHLYLAETTSGRVFRFRVNVRRGDRERTDGVRGQRGGGNLKLDDAGKIWAAVLLGNEMVMIDAGDRGAGTAPSVPSPRRSDRW